MGWRGRRGYGRKMVAMVEGGLKNVSFAVTSFVNGPFI